MSGREITVTVRGEGTRCDGRQTMRMDYVRVRVGGPWRQQPTDPAFPRVPSLPPSSAPFHHSSHRYTRPEAGSFKQSFPEATGSHIWLPMQVGQ